MRECASRSPSPSCSPWRAVASARRRRRRPTRPSIRASSAAPSASSTASAAARRFGAYIERMYCGPFARKGWVYADGALSIKAHVYIMNGDACSSVDLDSRRTDDDDPVRPARRWIRSSAPSCTTSGRDEVQAYIRKLKRKPERQLRRRNSSRQARRRVPGTRASSRRWRTSPSRSPARPGCRARSGPPCRQRPRRPLA